MTAVEAPTLLRASSLRDCPRKATYEATGAPARERYPAEERILYRGKSLGRDYVIFLATTNQWRVFVESGPDWWLPPELRADTAEQADVIAEKKIRWAHGIGHADLYVKETHTIVEVLSSAHASDEMRRSKLLQAVLYVEHDPAALNAALVVLNPSDFTEERTVLVPTSRMYTSLVAEMQERIGQIDAWKNTGDLPPRVCGKPSEARGHFCLYAGHCFEGWTAPPLQEIAADENLVTAVVEFDAIKKARAQIAREDKSLETRQKEAQALIEQADLPAGAPVQVGPFKVTRTAVQRKPTFDWERAEGAGLFEPGLYDDFFRPGSSYSTFKAERVDAAASDYGPVPF